MLLLLRSMLLDNIRGSALAQHKGKPVLVQSEEELSEKDLLDIIALSIITGILDE